MCVYVVTIPYRVKCQKHEFHSSYCIVPQLMDVAIINYCLLNVMLIYYNKIINKAIFQ